MLKNKSNYEKFSMLSPWYEEILSEIKKDLKSDHLKRDVQFFKTYFPSKNINKITVEELVHGYSQALKNKELAENLGEFISNRWLFKHSDMYYYFEENLKALNNDFQELEELDSHFGDQLMKQASQKFGPKMTYIFSIMNSVVFPKATYDLLKEQALLETEQGKESEVQELELKGWHEKEKFYELQISRLEERYKDKLLGMQKKYERDVEALKKQISMLQRKLDEKKSLQLV